MAITYRPGAIEDSPAVLAHAERAAERAAEFGAEVPLINRAAVDYLLARGCRMEPFFAFLLTDAPSAASSDTSSPAHPSSCSHRAFSSTRRERLSIAAS